MLSDMSILKVIFEAPIKQKLGSSLN